MILFYHKFSKIINNLLNFQCHERINSTGHFSSHCGRNFKSHKGRQYCEEKCSGNDQNYECPTCGTKFQHKYRLDLHMKTHTGERNFGCPIPGCTSAYYTKSNVGIHIKLTHKLDHKEVFAEYGGPIKLWCADSHMGKIVLLVVIFLRVSLHVMQ